MNRVQKIAAGAAALLAAQAANAQTPGQEIGNQTVINGPISVDRSVTVGGPEINTTVPVTVPVNVRGGDTIIGGPEIETGDNTQTSTLTNNINTRGAANGAAPSSFVSGPVGCGTSDGGSAGVGLFAFTIGGSKSSVRSEGTILPYTKGEVASMDPAERDRLIKKYKLNGAQAGSVMCAAGNAQEAQKDRANMLAIAELNGDILVIRQTMTSLCAKQQLAADCQTYARTVGGAAATKRYGVTLNFGGSTVDNGAAPAPQQPQPLAAAPAPVKAAPAKRRATVRRAPKPSCSCKKVSFNSSAFGGQSYNVTGVTFVAMEGPSFDAPEYAAA